MTFLQLMGACVVVALAFYGLLALATVVYKRSTDAMAKRTFLTRRVTLEQVAEFAESDCKHCHGTGILNRRTGAGRNASSYPIPCACASRRFMRKHEQETTMLGQFRIWKRGHGPRARVAARSAAA
jgi:hypothetical protein